MAPKVPKPKKLPRKAQTRTPNTPLWRRTTSLFVTTIGLIAAGLTFLPRVTAVPSDPPDTNDPFSSSVTITNNGFIPLNAVSANISWGTIKFMGPKGPTVLLGDEARQAFKVEKWPSHDLGLDDGFTVSLNDALGADRSSLLEAQIAITVKYDLPFIHWEREKRFPLFAKKASNGNFYWYKDTISKSPN